MAKLSDLKITLDIDPKRYTDAIKDLGESTNDAQSALGKFKGIAGSIDVASAFARYPYYREVIQQVALWERRFYTYQRDYPEKPEGYRGAIIFYEALVQMAHSLSKEQSPERVMRIDTGSGFAWLTAKEVAQGMAKKPLPDIDPQDAIELSKVTPFSAEEWYRGCTGSPVE